MNSSTHDDQDSGNVTLPSRRTPDHDLKQDHPELYGRLLIANEKIENVGTLAVWLMLALVLGICVTIHMGWVAIVFGIPVEQLQGWGVYILIAVVCFVIYSVYTHFAEKAAYRSLRQPVMHYLNQHNLTVPWLVARTENDSSVNDISEQLKTDTSSMFQGGPVRDSGRGFWFRRLVIW